MTDQESPVSVTFQDLDLPDPLLHALKDLGYETPSPIQAETIPTLLEGRDLLGQAQTGTGKTAAFALPMLARLDLKLKQPQLLVLAPTRELAIQVAEAFQSYAHHLKDFHVLPIYGGQSYDIQLRQLKRGVQVVVGTPGRVMDHMRRGTLKLDALTGLVWTRPMKCCAWDSSMTWNGSWNTHRMIARLRCSPQLCRPLSRRWQPRI
jgi:ATP-dependent RNA helicase DeaD